MTFGQAVRKLDLREPLTGERITAKALLRILKEDVVYALERPGSWEGARMLEVFQAHGFFNKKPFNQEGIFPSLEGKY